MICNDFDDNDYVAISAFCNSIQLAYILVSVDYLIIDINLIAEKIFTCTKAQALHKNLSSLCGQKSLQLPFKALSKKELSENNVFLTNTIHELSDKRMVEVQWSCSNHLDCNGYLKGYLFIGKLFHVLEPLDNDKKLISLKNLIALMPGAVYAKDTQGVYLMGNDYVNNIGGFKKENDIVNKTDDDTSWYKVADQLRAADQQAIRFNETIIKEERPLLADGTCAVMLSTKAPLHDEEGNVIGIVGTSVNIAKLKQEQVASYTSENCRINLDEHNHDIHLTKREIECVSWLIKGKSAEEIAIIIKTSKHTVESHLKNIKKKTRCYKQF